MATTGPPPPPRRAVPLTSSASTEQQLGSGNTNSTDSNDKHTLWDKTKTKSRQTWDSLYHVADKIGYWSNSKAAKLGTEAFYPTSLDLECIKCARIVRMMSSAADPGQAPSETLEDTKKAQQRVLRKIPASVFEQAQGVAIFTVFRTGFLVSGSGGSGIVLARHDSGGWSAPSGILLHTIGFGFLAGIDVYDVVLILRTQAAVDAFTHPRVSLGAELGVTAGPMGAGHVLETSIDKSPSPVWAYTKSRGAYVGVALEGTVFIERNDENARSYGREVKASEILAGNVNVPLWAESLHQTLDAAAGRGEFPNLPQPASPPVQSARRLPQSGLDASDLAVLQKMEASLYAMGIQDTAINAHNREVDPCMIKGDQLEDLSTSSPRTSLSAGGSPKVSADVKRRTVAPPPPPVPPRRTPKTATPDLGQGHSRSASRDEGLAGGHEAQGLGIQAAADKGA
ncbi:hypothetical protein ACM66B_000787 [Microbotryomycetes sp. NB124-2]